MNKLVVTALALTLVLGGAPASARAQGALCDINTQNRDVNKGAQSLIDATREEAERQERLLNDARDILVRAIERGAADDAAAWYWLGMYYGMIDDPIAADSAFDRTEELKPECVEETRGLRASVWGARVTAGLDSLRNGRLEGAMHQLQMANVIHGERNLALYYTAMIFLDQGVNDSALYYLKRVADIGAADTLGLQQYAQALNRIATLYSARQEWDSAATWAWSARDVDASDGNMLLVIARAYEQLGDQERLMMTYDSVLANAATVEPDSLFKMGAKLFVTGQAGRAAGMFESGLAQNRYHRNGLFNLASVRLAIVEDDRRPQADRDRAAAQLLQLTQRLTALDPANGESLGLLATAFELQQMPDSAAAARRRSDDLVVEVRLRDASAYEGGYSALGTISNVGNTAIETPAVTFAFLDAEGNVVTTQTVSGATLQMGAEITFNVDATGAGIVAWRYTVGSSGQ